MGGDHRRLPTVETLRRRSGEERGVVLVLVAFLMVAILGMAALAIDLGSYWQAQRQAQSAADAGALAASQDFANNPSAATADGTTYATANFPGSTVTVSTNAALNQATVSVTAATPTFFGKILGLSKETVSAHAVASETGAPCVTAGNTCYAIFASDTNCTSGNYGVTFNGAGDNVTGGVHSNGSIDLVGGSQTLGPTTYGNGSGCVVTTGGSGDTYSSGPTAEAPLPWPLDYSKVLTACGGSGEVACTGPGGTPSYCTVASTSNITIASGAANGVYCAVGSGTASDPSTYRGYINLTDTATAPIVSVTMIAGAVQCGVKSCAAQSYQASYPLAYVADTDAQASSAPASISYAFTGTGKDENFTGAIFAPNGTINFNGKGGTDNFLEGKDVILTGQGFTGIGPQDGSGLTAASTESLIQ